MAVNPLSQPYNWLLGIIIAPLLSVVCQILWNLLVSDRLSPERVVQVSDLKERQVRLQLAIEEMEGPPSPLVVSSMERLAGLLEKAEPVLQVAPSQHVTDEDGITKPTKA